MKKSQINRIAHMIVRNEQILADSDSSKEEKEKAEKEITKYMFMIAALPNSAEVIGQIDDIVQKNI